MKLSVCIPVYNFDVRELISDLKKEIEIKQIDAEIILIDDASDKNFKSINESLQNEVQSFIFLEKNIGRSKIRNLFLKYTRGEYLLFLDCDVKIDNENFLQNYLSEINRNDDLGLIYGNFKIAYEHSNSLRNRYSVEREIFKGNRLTDFSLFKTVNFIIKREVFEKFSFNEDLTEYGYEDFVFAKLLEQNRIKFLAINNPVIHFDDTPNDIFLTKTETGIDSLFKLSKNPQNQVFIKNIKVYKAASRLKQLRCDPLFLFFYSLFEKKIKSNLLSENPSVMVFDFYKLALILRRMK